MTDAYNRDPRLPWGHWMRLEAGPGSASYVDEDGRRWPSIREFFWRSRLNMPLHDRSTMEAGLERIMTVLAARDGVTRHLVEIGHDLYDGEHAFSQFHAHWLHSVGLIGGGRDARDAPYDGRTTPEGRAVVMMLMTTRSPKLYGVPIGGDAVKILSRTPREDHASDEAWLASVEAKATQMTHAFVRTEVGGHHGIALHYRDVGAAMPMVRTTWSMILTDRASRDDLYRWIAERGDRWDDWGDRAFRSGGSALTQHLLALIVATMTPEAQNEPPLAGPDMIALPAPR